MVPTIDQGEFVRGQEDQEARFGCGEVAEGRNSMKERVTLSQGHPYVSRAVHLSRFCKRTSKIAFASIALVSVSLRDTVYVFGVR